MAIIIPAILAASEEEVSQRLLHALEFAEDVQVDVVDGKFAEPASWPYSIKGFSPKTATISLPHAEELKIELDIMVEDPEKYLATWMNSGATRFLFHIESTADFGRLLATLKDDYGYSKGFMPGVLTVGLAINQDTRLELIEPYVDQIDYVQFMGIKNIGKQGQPFSKDVYTLIQRFRHAHPDVPVQVDGGVSIDVAAELLKLGVSRLIIGSALWKTKDPRITYQTLASVAEKFGIYE